MRHYTKEHLWIETRTDGGIAIGITQYGKDMLEDIVYVDLPERGRAYRKGEALCTIESRKTVHEVLSPCDGTVCATAGGSNGSDMEGDVCDALNTAPESCMLCAMDKHSFNPDDAMSKEHYEEYLEKAFGWRDGK